MNGIDFLSIPPFLGQLTVTLRNTSVNPDNPVVENFRVIIYSKVSGFINNKTRQNEVICVDCLVGIVKNPHVKLRLYGSFLL